MRRDHTNPVSIEYRSAADHTLHRVDGPARIIFSSFLYDDGGIHACNKPYRKVVSKGWYRKDRLHNTNGPARITYNPDGIPDVYFVINDEYLTIEHYRLYCLIRGYNDGLESTYKKLD